MKKIILIFGVLLSLGVFCACSKSDETTDSLEGKDSSSRSDTDEKWIEAEGALANYCFDGVFVMESKDGRVVVWLDENPIDTLSQFGFCYVAFQKTDLPDREYKEGDHIFFKIKKHGEPYGEYGDDYIFAGYGVYVRYNCIVEPC